MARRLFPIESGNGTGTAATSGTWHRRVRLRETLDERILGTSSLRSPDSSHSQAIEGRPVTSRPVQEDEKLTLGDRLISALLCGLWGFATMVFVWVIAFDFVFVPMNDFVWTLCTWTTWIASGAAAALGLLLGPERMMDGFARVWSAIDQWLRGEDG